MSHPMLSLYECKGFGTPGATLFQQWSSDDKCPACSTKVSQKSPKNATIWVGSGGTKWTDVLANIDGLLLHERAVDIITRDGLTGFRAHPVAIEKVESKDLSGQPAPRYYLIEITGTADIDPNEVDDEGGSICPVCFCRTPKDDNPYRWAPKRLVPKLATWDGSDFVRLRNLRTARKFCSKRFIDLASKHQWTNFRFGETLPGICLSATPSEGQLSYYDMDWFDKFAQRVRAKHPDLFESAGS